ncbi:uncharacterized protein G2W53_040730 [Senna tora]|uniref:Uncharacterized protein n=1 Tax=Senna tora TaxID=362788 RepID=A0A834W295_9FABA|nr:uncharacterized protein G2W53_040730 [Senna tora]
MFTAVNCRAQPPFAISSHAPSRDHQPPTTVAFLTFISTFASLLSHSRKCHLKGRVLLLVLQETRENFDDMSILESVEALNCFFYPSSTAKKNFYQ